MIGATSVKRYDSLRFVGMRIVLSVSMHCWRNLFNLKAAEQLRRAHVSML